MTKAWALLLIVILTLDVCPWTVPLVSYIKTPLSAVLNRVGVSQGEWSMFAPNPVINNGWITAEMKTTGDGEKLQWESPIWSRASGWDKFIKFRSMNYFNRLNKPSNYPAAADLMEYLARNADQPVDQIQLYRNQMTLIMPEDGSLPPRDEAEWRLLPQPWLDRRQLK